MTLHFGLAKAICIHLPLHGRAATAFAPPLPLNFPLQSPPLSLPAENVPFPCPRRKIPNFAPVPQAKGALAIQGLVNNLMETYLERVMISRPSYPPLTQDAVRHLSARTLHHQPHVQYSCHCVPFPCEFV